MRESYQWCGTNIEEMEKGAIREEINGDGDGDDGKRWVDGVRWVERKKKRRYSET